MDKSAPIDPDILKNYANTPEDVAVFASVFIRQTAQDLENLRLCEREGGARWVDVCHKIRGASSMAGAHVMTELCHEGETLADASYPVRAALCRRMADAFDAVCESFSLLSPSLKSLRR